MGSARDSTALKSSADDDLVDLDDPRSREEIDIVVVQIKRLVRMTGLEFALRVGAVIIHHFYGGDAEAWRSRGPKTSSFRRLAQHPDLPLSPGALYRCVALFELCDRLNAPSRWEHLGASHLRVVLGLPSNMQERMLAEANANRWTVKTLAREVLREKSSRVTSGGRRAEPPIAKSLRSVRKCLENHHGAIAQVDQLSSQELEQSMLLVEQAKACLERLSFSLQAAMASANDCESRSLAPGVVESRDTASGGKLRDNARKC